MSEPTTVAERTEQVVPGVWNWHVVDDRISFRSDAHAVATDAGAVLIDPLPLDAAALKSLGPIAAVCLTAACHQRASWRYRAESGVQVYAPEGGRETDEEPDARYRAGDRLPGGLRAVHTPGPEVPHYALLRETEPRVLFCADLLMHPEGGGLEFVPAQYHADAAATRESVKTLLDLDFAVLCLDHGAPVIDAPHAALRELLDRTA